LKHRSTRFIHYSEPNQEPEEHIKAKDRIRHILYNFDFNLINNTDDRHKEFKLPPVVTDLIAETEEEKIREYQIDVLMHSRISNMIIAVEVNGPYHLATKKAIQKTNMKHRAIVEYLATHHEIQVKKNRRIYIYPYTKYRVVAITSEEGYGRLSLDRQQLIDRLFNE
jgi:hypothetical protein